MIMILTDVLLDLIEISSVPYLDSPPTPLEFYRDFVSQNKPVKIKSE